MAKGIPPRPFLLNRYEFMLIVAVRDINKTSHDVVISDDIRLYENELLKLTIKKVNNTEMSKIRQEKQQLRKILLIVTFWAYVIIIIISLFIFKYRLEDTNSKLIINDSLIKHELDSTYIENHSEIK